MECGTLLMLLNSTSKLECHVVCMNYLKINANLMRTLECCY